MSELEKGDVVISEAAFILALLAIAGVAGFIGIIWFVMDIVRFIEAQK